MARFKDFDAALAERNGEPITFKLGGRQWTANHVNAETFLVFVRHASEGGDALVLAFADFIDAALPEQDRQAFHAMLNTHDVPIDVVMDLAKWVIEQAAGNPTDAVSQSPQQRSRRGQRPRVVSLSGASSSKGPRSAVS